jgi:hypothetical protein
MIDIVGCLSGGEAVPLFGAHAPVRSFRSGALNDKEKAPSPES